MKVRTVVLVSSAIEVVTGVALIAIPAFVGRLLLGVELPAIGIVVARVGGLALLTLGISCWPRGVDAPRPAVRALFAYNLVAAVGLGYLGVGAGFDGYLLWPACAVHVLLTVLLARAAYETFSPGAR